MQPVLEASSALIESAYWLDISANSSIPLSVLPDPSACLIGTKMGDSSHRCTLVGPRSVALSIDRRWRTQTCLTRLNPGAVQRILGIPANELCDQSIRVTEASFADFQMGSSPENLCRLLDATGPGEGITRPQMLVDAFCQKKPN